MTTTAADTAILAVENIAPALASVVSASPIAPFLSFIGRNVRAHPLRAALVGCGALLLVVAHHRERRESRRRRATWNE
jgi:hypothetical protein